jgi:GNAT superfamily N-acetyltransferase
MMCGMQGSTAHSVTSPFVVRRATNDDAAAIAGVHVRSWRSAYRGQMPDAVLDGLSESERAAAWRRWLAPADHGVQVAVAGGAVIGFCSLIAARDADLPGGTGEVAAIYVLPEHWRSRAGSVLMLAALELARQRGYRGLTLWVLASNDRARRFYERCGFVADGAEKVQRIGDHGPAPGAASVVEVRYRLEPSPER